MNEEEFEDKETPEERAAEVSKEIKAASKFLPAELYDMEYNQAKNNINILIADGMESLSELKDVAMQSQHPRSYEVLANLISTLVAANKTILDMKKVNTDINERDPSNRPEKSQKYQQQNIFVGSTAELGELLKKNGQSGA